ncbi:MAG: iron ABC transporter permease [Betaproteobacteria bacterium]|nr:iron ABC transporter permease [Betaproteobacteria bacterium]
MTVAVLARLRGVVARLDWRDPLTLTVIAVAVVLAYLGLFPTVMLLVGSFSTADLGQPGDATLANYVAAYTDPETFRLLLDSFVFALGSSFISITFALALAWITVRTNAPFRGIFELTAIVPNIFPPVLIAISWTLLLSPSVGLINALLKSVFDLSEAPFNIYSMPGLVFVEGLILTPLAFLIISAALRGMDPALEESARMLGSSQFRIVRSVTFPLMRPAILAAATLNFVRALESFDTPAIIALPARIEVFTTKIYREAFAAYPPNYNLAATYGVSLLVIALVFVYLYRRFTSRVETFATITGKGFRPHIIDLGRWKFVASASALAILVLMVVLPVTMLFFTSLLPYYQVPTMESLQQLTLKHYGYIFENERVYRAMGNSLLLAVTGASVAMFLAALTAYITVKTKVWGRGMLEGLTFLPWAFPSTALAIGLLWGYVQMPLPVYGTLWILLIAYVTRFLPYGLRAVTSTIVQIHSELEEASRACGGGFWMTFRRILFPLMRPGLIAGWILLATIFMREFSLSLFLYSPSSEPVGPLLYFLWLDGMTGPLGALGMLVSVVSAVLVLAARRYARADE